MMTQFRARLVCPDTSNEYYIPQSAGGWNPCIPKPTGSKLIFQNCVFYAVGRFNEIAGNKNCDLLKSTNAENFASIAKNEGLSVGTEPQLGAVAVWAKGKVGDGSDGAGHVAIVEEIYDDGSILTSESGWSASKPFWTTCRKNSGGNWGQSAAYRFIGFIYQPQKSQSKTYPVMRKGDKGDGVVWLQTELATLGYYAGKIDGSFGKQTLGAVLAYQMEHGLEVDGVCGPKTKAAICAMRE